MKIEGSQVFRSGRSRATYGRVKGSVSARLSEDGDELLIESSIPVSKGFSDVCFVLPVDALPELVRIGLAKGQPLQNSES